MDSVPPGAEELFRFVTVTSVAQATTSDIANAVIEGDPSRPEPHFLQQLRDLVQGGGSLDASRGLAAEHVGSTNHVTTLGLAKLGAAAPAGAAESSDDGSPGAGSGRRNERDDDALEADVRRLAETLDPATDDLGPTLHRLLGRSVDEIVQDSAFVDRLVKLWGSMYAVYLLAGSNPAELARIVDAIGVGEFLVRAAADPALLDDVERRTAVLTASPLLPASVFGGLMATPTTAELPLGTLIPVDRLGDETDTVSHDLGSGMVDIAPPGSPESDASLRQAIRAVEATIDDLEHVESERMAAAAAHVPTPTPEPVSPGRGGSESVLVSQPHGQPLPWTDDAAVPPWRLTAAEVQRLSPATRSVLEGMDIDAGLTIPTTIEALERRRGEWLLALHSGGQQQ